MKHFPKGTYGVDKQGRPIIIERSGLYELDKVFELVTHEEFWQNWCQTYEIQNKLYMLATSCVHQKQIHHTLNITDLSSFSLSMMNSSTYGLLQKHL